MLKPITVLPFFLLIALFCPAQTVPGFKTLGAGTNDSLLDRQMQAPQARQYVFTQFTTANGLTSNYINNITQDHKGYMWLSTSNGLQRYDGNKFVSFKNQPSNPKSIPDDNVAFVFEDRNENLWVATTDDKIGIFDKSAFTYREVKINYAVKSTLYSPKGLFETSKGVLIMSVAGQGLFVLDEKKNEFRPTEDILPVPKNWKYLGIFEDTIKNRFLLSCDSGMVIWNPAKRQMSYRGHNLENDPIINEYGNLTHTFGAFIDKYNRLLFGTWTPRQPIPTLYYYDIKTGEKREHLLSETIGSGYYEILGMFQQKNGRLWIYGLSFLLEYANEKKPLRAVRNDYKDYQGLKVNKINNMFEDRQKNVWICSDNGVFFFNPDAQFFNAYTLLRHDGTGVIEGITQSVCEVGDRVFIGGWGNGLYFYDRAFAPASIPPSLAKFRDAYSIWSMIQHKSSGLVWMGLQAGSIIVYDPVKEKSEIFSPAVFEGKTIRCVIEDKQGNIWFGTHRGKVIKWNKNAANGDYKSGFEEVLQTGLVHKLFCDKEGYVWVATLGHGLVKIDPRTNKVVDKFMRSGPAKQTLWSDAPSDIAQLNDSVLLVSGGAIDMLNIRTRKVVHISTEDGLPSNNVNTMSIDKNGIIWLGTANGLCRFNIEIGTFTMYDRRDGVSYDAFGVGDAHQLEDGRMVFTSDRNFMVFDPKQMVQSFVPPDAMITDFKLDNESLSMDSLNKLQKVILDYHKNSIIVEFSALNFLNRQKLHYHYQLEGLEGPREGTDHGQAIYNYIPPGSYTFTVYAETADGVSSKNVTSIKIYVQYPFYQTWWFYAFIVLVICLVLYWIDRERIKKFRAIQHLRTLIAGNLHKEIDTNLNNISLLSEMAKIKADNDIERSKEYIDQINEKSRKMIVSMDDVFWSIDPANDSMERTLLRMEEFVSAMKNRHGANIDLAVDEKVKSLKMDMVSRHEIYVIFRRALRNIARNAHGAPILINVDFVKPRLSVKIQSNGTYGPIETLYDNEKINDISKRAESIKALLDIQSDNKKVSVILNVEV